MFGDKDEIEHFRQVIVNVVLAADIFVEELNADRWEGGFRG
jgi:hypothetical protein